MGMRVLIAVLGMGLVGAVLADIIRQQAQPVCLPHQGVGAVVCCHSMFCFKQIGASTEPPDPWADNMGQIHQVDGGVFCVLTECAP